MPGPRAEPATLNVGYVLKKYPRISETFILNEILGLEEAGVRVSIFSLTAPDEGRFHADLARVRGAVRYLPAFGSVSTLQAFQAVRALGIAARLDRALDFLDRLPPEKRTALLVHALHLARAVREEEIDHLHAHFMTVAAHAAYLAHVLVGVPFSVTAHAKDIYRNTVDPAVFRTIAEAASCIVTVSEFNRSFISERLLGGDGGKVRRIYNGIVVEDFGHRNGAREPGLILGVGRLVEKKGFHLLLRACRILLDRGQDLRCVIIGDGEEQARLVEERRGLGLEDRVTFAGSLPRDEVIRWLKRARVLCAPCILASDGNQDALPTVLIEALAAGLPAVATRISGIPEIVDDGTNGILVPDGDVGAFADAVGALLADDSRWARLSEAGPRKARDRFDRRATLPPLIDVFRAAAERSRDGREGRS